MIGDSTLAAADFVALGVDDVPDILQRWYKRPLKLYFSDPGLFLNVIIRLNAEVDIEDVWQVYQIIGDQVRPFGPPHATMGEIRNALGTFN